MRQLFLSLVILLALLWANTAQACEFCTIANLGKKDKPVGNESRFQAEVFFENQDWKEIPAREAHELHHDGHHVHDKMHEEILHTLFSVNVSDNLQVEIDIPFVTRHFIEIDSHANLGSNQKSQGLGDITVTGDYRFILDERKTFGILAGVKAPSGETDEHNSFGGLIEPELQPGTGSVDYILGFASSYHAGDFNFSASAVHVFKTEGKQDFRFGDVASIAFHADKNTSLNADLTLKTGILLNHQFESKQNNNSGDIADSGGHTFLAGPQVGLEYKEAQIEFSHLFPAIQNLGGLHQELEGIWTTALSLKF